MPTKTSVPSNGLSKRKPTCAHRGKSTDSRCVPAPKPLCAPRESYSIPTIAFECGRDKLPAQNPCVLICSISQTNILSGRSMEVLDEANMQRYGRRSIPGRKLGLDDRVHTD
jgi:hypothetical protein